jgi:recombination protein RecA
MPPANTRALAAFQAKMDKTYGEGVFRMAGEPTPYEVLSTGSILFDRATIVGGYVKGRSHEIWGPEDGGKTTLAFIAVAQAQRQEPDKIAVYIDMEHKVDRKYAKALGVDLGRMMLVLPDNAEELADQVKDSIRSGVVSIVVLDSIGGMISQAEKDKTAGEVTVANVPRIVSRMVNIAAVEAPKTGTVVFIINQVREKVGQKHGNPETTPGGRALKHATTMKIKVSKVFDSSLKARVDGELREVAHRIAILVQRSKVGPAYRACEITLFTEPSKEYGSFVGIDTASEAVQLGVEQGIIKQAGAWYSLVADPEQKAQGKPGMAALLRTQRPDLIATIRQSAIDALSSLVVIEEPFDPETIPDDLIEIGDGDAEGE